VRLFDPRLMELLTFLTRRQAWLTPEQIVRSFRAGGERVAVRTLHRWFRFLHEEGSFVYYPYPRANRLGLQDVLVRVHGLRDPTVLGLLPFAASFKVEVGLGDSRPFVSQGYWVPGSAMEDFEDFWRTVRDLGFAEDVELFPSRNTHYVYSPFELFTTAEGVATLHGKVDNRYFADLLRTHLTEPFEVELAQPYSEDPLIIPLVVEHIWAHHSSRQVWDAIREKGWGAIRAYGKPLASRFDRRGSALRLLQLHWSALLRDFDAVFLQPRVGFDWTSLRSAMFVSFVFDPGSVDRLVEAVRRASERSIDTAVRAGVGAGTRCHLSCFAPSDQFPALLEAIRESHQGPEPPQVAVEHREATLDLFRPAFCRLDWRLFDPGSLSWRFDALTYLERLKSLRNA